MGNFFSSYYAKLMSYFDRKANILMLGLDSAGKTTILYKLKLDALVNTIPTIGFNVECVKFKSLNMTIWDVGGQEKIRPLWRHYYQNVDAVIFVVDSNDGGRMDEVSKELHSLMAEDELRNSIVLVLCNKQDLPNALSVQEINEKVGLIKLKQKWYVQPTTAIFNEGIFEGLEWLYNNLGDNSRDNSRDNSIDNSIDNLGYN